MGKMGNQRVMLTISDAFDDMIEDYYGEYRKRHVKEKYCSKAECIRRSLISWFKMGGFELEDYEAKYARD